MYAGLTTADKGALLDAQKYGKWIAKDASGALYAYRNKPVKKSLMGEWYDMTWVALNWIYISFIQWSDPEPVNIDLALAQIAEMETAQTHTMPPLTWNERINQMTVEEKSETFVVESSVTLDIGSGKKEYPIWITPLIDGVSFTNKEAAINYNKDHLASPYTEGETK